MKDSELLCDGCGKPIPADRLIERDARMLCRDCAGAPGKAALVTVGGRGADHFAARLALFLSKCCYIVSAVGLALIIFGLWTGTRHPMALLGLWLAGGGLAVFIWMSVAAGLLRAFPPE